MKSGKRKKRRKYINGMKGTISIFMALIISPILSVSLVLVEAVRYQHAIESVQEVIDMSAFSTLANYDSYLDKRFGLLATAQDEDVSSQFSKYLSANKNVLGKGVTVNSENGRGAYALSDIEVLKQQILEFGQISVLSEVVIEGLDLEQLLKELKKAIKLEKINKEIKKVNNTAELAKELTKLIKNIVKLKDEYSTFCDLRDEYSDAYDDFKEKMQAVISSKKDAKAVTDAETSCRTYYKSADSLKKSLDKMKKYISDIFTGLERLSEKIKTMGDILTEDVTESSTEDTSEGSAEDNTEDTSEGSAEESESSVDGAMSSYKWILAIANQALKVLNDTLGTNCIRTLDKDIDELEKQKCKLKDLEGKIETDICTDSEIESEYGPVKLESIWPDLMLVLNNLIMQLNAESTMEQEQIKQLHALMAMVQALMDTKGVYDTALNAKVDSNCLYTAANMSLTSTLVINSITSLIEAGEDFADGIKDCNIIKTLEVLVDLLEAVASFLASIVTWVGESLINLITYIGSGPEEWYNGILLYGYGAYNMPNRTNCRKGKTITGFKYSDVASLAGGIKAPGLIGSIKDLSGLNDSVSGSDQMFKGAHAEYLIAGSNSEICNQAITFFDLFLFRVLLNILPVIKNPEVIEMSSNPAGWLIMLLIVIGESAIDSTLLVNGVSVNLIKKVVYMTPSGVPVLLKDAAGMDAFAKNMQEYLRDIIKKNSDGPIPDKTGYLNASYTEHLILLLLLSVKQDEYLRRVQNLIQMEAACKHKYECEFTLNNANTCVIGDVDYTLNPMFNIEGLTDKGPFKKSTWQFVGY